MTFLLKLLSTQMEFCINLLLKWKHKNIYRLTLISIISFSDNFSWESFYNLKRRFPLSITPLSEHPTLKIQVKDSKHDAHQSSWGDWDAGRTEFGIFVIIFLNHFVTIIQKNQTWTNFYLSIHVNSGSIFHNNRPNNHYI